MDFSTLVLILVVVYLLVMFILFLNYPDFMRIIFINNPKFLKKAVKAYQTKNRVDEAKHTKKELGTREIKYKPRKNLFTPTEQKFLSVLESIAGSELKVFGKIRISDILTPDVNQWKKGSGWHWLFSQISQKHVDFVITDKDLKLICAVELNDPSHEREDRIKRDQFVLKAFQSADVPLVMINTQNEYFEEHVADIIAKHVVGI